MKIYKIITDMFVKIVSVLLMLLIAGLVGLILYELLIRNLFNKSFRATTELCGFMFMWMAFLGIIYLYDQDRLLRFEMFYARSKEPVTEVLWFVNKVVSLILGVTMVAACVGMYPVTSTTYFSTMQFLSMFWHFLPMGIAGGYIVVKTIYQLIEKITAIVHTKVEGQVKEL